MSEDKFLQALNESLGKYLPRQASWRYFSLGVTLFCWNTEPFTDEPKPWAAWKYRRNIRKGTFRKFGKTLYFAHRNKAKARALKWYKKAVEDKATHDRAVAQAGGE